MKCAVALAMSRASDTYVNLKISLGISWRVQPQLLLLLFCYHDQSSDAFWRLTRVTAVSNRHTVAFGITM